MRFPNSTYDPETVALMGRAYDDAAKAAQILGLGIGFSEAVQSAMAKRIMAAVSEGERDIERLKLCALSAIELQTTRLNH
jgi:hypothetical protein